MEEYYLRILCLHGFLGRASDFDFLKKDYEVIAPELSEYVSMQFDELLSSFRECYLNEVDIILGYSFGARLGSRLIFETKLDIPMICLAGHGGLKTSSEKKERIKFEKEIIKKLGEQTETEFLRDWNNYGIFSHDQPVIDGNFKNAVLYFKNYGL